jgi:hypothetical protein
MTTKLLATSLVAAALLATCLLTTGLMPAGTAAEPPVPRESTSLSERLKAGLQARLPQEFAYADRVAALVEQGELPVKLVDTAFAWARKKGGKYPFPYFRRVLEIQASLIGVKI